MFLEIFSLLFTLLFSHSLGCLLSSAISKALFISLYFLLPTSHLDWRYFKFTPSCQLKVAISSSSDFFIIFWVIYFMCMGVLCFVCMYGCALHACLVPWRPGDSDRSPGLKLQTLIVHHVGTGNWTKPRSIKEHLVSLTTRPSLQHPIYWVCCFGLFCFGVLGLPSQIL